MTIYTVRIISTLTNKRRTGIVIADKLKKAIDLVNAELDTKGGWEVIDSISVSRYSFVIQQKKEE